MTVYAISTPATEHCGAKIIPESRAASMYAQGHAFDMFTDARGRTVVLFRLGLGK